MTVRIPQMLLQLDNRRLAAILTPALLAPASDDAAPKAGKVGTGWVRFCDAHGVGPLAREN